MPVGHHYALVLELRPMDSMYTCVPCECYWVNEPTCFVCGVSGTLVVGKSDAAGFKEHRRFNQEVLNLNGTDGRVVSPSIRFRSQGI